MDSPSKSYQFSSRNQSFTDSHGLREVSSFESVKHQLEKDYSEKLQAARSIYEKRLKSLSKIAGTFKEVASRDEVLQAMKENAVSEQFVQDRLEEIYEEIMHSEKEAQVSKLQQELIQKNSELLHLQQSLLEFKLNSEESRMRNSNEQQLRHQIAELEDYIHSLNSQDSSQQLLAERNSLVEQLDAANSKFKQIIEAEQRASTDTFEELHKKFKTKSKKFKNKIRQQKDNLMDQEMQIQSYRKASEDYRKQLESQHTDLKKVRDEWEKRCNDQQNEFHQKEIDIAKRHQTQISQLQTQFQQIMEQRINELQEELQRQTPNKGEYVAKAQYLQAVEERHQLSEELKSLYKEKLASERLADQRANELSDLNRRLEEIEAKDMTDHYRKTLDETNIKVGKLEVTLEESQKRKLEAEKETGKAKSDIENFKRTINDLRDEIKGLNRDKEHFSEQLENSNTKINSVQQELDQAIRKNSQLISDLNSKSFEVQELSDVSENLQRESDSHLQTRSKLLQVEGSYQQLSEDVKSYEKRIEELKSQLRTSEEQNTTLNSKVYEYDSALSSGNTERRNLQKQLNKLATSNFEYKHRTHELLKIKSRSLRSDLSKLHTFAVEEIQMLRKDCNSFLQTLLYKSIESTNFVRKHYDESLATITDQMSAKWVEKIEGVENSLENRHSLALEQYKDRLNSQEKQIESLRANASVLKNEQQAYVEECENLRRKNNKLENAVESLRTENAVLESKLQKNAQSFDKLQEEVYAITQQSKKEYLERHHIDQSKIQEYTDKVFALEGQIRSIQDEHEKEIYEVKKKYQELLDSAYHDVQNEGNKHLKVRKHLHEIEDEASFLQHQHETSLKQFLAQIESLQRVVNSQNDMHKELEAKQIELHTQVLDRERLKKKFQELQAKIDTQADKFYTQLAIKDKEIEHLKEVLNSTLEPPRRMFDESKRTYYNS